MKNDLKLIFQGNIQIYSTEEGSQMYEELKIFLKAFDEKCTLNGQILQMLEPCCKEKEKQNVTT